MADSIRLSFSGRLDTEHLQLDHEEVRKGVALLQERSGAIAQEISERITASLGLPPNVSIDFHEGSIEWSGWVEWVRTAWGTIDAMSTLGGAIGLIQIIRAAVDSVLRRWFDSALGLRRSGIFPNSRVVLVSGPVDFSQGAWQRQFHWVMFGIAAVILSVATLLASVGFLLWVLRP